MDQKEEVIVVCDNDNLEDSFEVTVSNQDPNSFPVLPSPPERAKDPSATKSCPNLNGFLKISKLNQKRKMRLQKRPRSISKSLDGPPRKRGLFPVPQFDPHLIKNSENSVETPSRSTNTNQTGVIHSADLSKSEDAFLPNKYVNIDDMVKSYEKEYRPYSSTTSQKTYMRTQRVETKNGSNPIPNDSKPIPNDSKPIPNDSNNSNNSNQAPKISWWARFVNKLDSFFSIYCDCFSGCRSKTSDN